MKVLLTGSQGLVGKWMVKTLLDAGHTVRTIDRAAQRSGSDWEHIPGDVRDIALMRRAVQGMDAVIHAAAILEEVRGQEDILYSVNIQGVWNVLIACAEAGIGRLVNFSSLQALGHSNKRHTALSLPLDDDIPRQPATAYQTSKYVGEEMCQVYALHHNMTIASLRPTAILQPEPEENRWWRSLQDDVLAHHATNDYWSFVDVRDVCQAALLCLTAPLEGHQAFLLTSDYTYARIPTVELAQKYYPAFPWLKVSPEEYTRGNPYRSLINCWKAKQTLGWQPVHSQRQDVLKVFAK